MLSYSLYEKNNKKNFNIYFNDNTAISNQNEITQQNNISNIQNMTPLFTLINTQQKIANQFHISLDSQILNEPSNDISSNTNSSPSINQTNLIENEKFKSHVSEFFDKIKLRMLGPRLKRIESKLKSIGVNNANKINEIIKRLSPSQASEFLNELERLVDILSSDDLEKKLHSKVVKAIKESKVVKAIEESKVVKAIKESTNHLSMNVGIGIGIGIEIKREFETLKDFAIKLLTDLIDVLADPNLIFQEFKGTCAQTTVERSIAERNPTQYVKIITDLITKGEYIAPNGQRIPLNEGGIKKALFETDNRYLTTRIITPSFMEFYYKRDNRYLTNGIITPLFMQFHHDKDPNKNYYDDDNDVPSGSLSERTASAIYNTEYNSIDVGYFNNFNNTEKTLILKTLLKKSKYPIFLGVNYGKDPNDFNAGHAVELKSITDNSITISNPWGQIETYTTTGKNIENSKHRDGYNTEIQDYQDFIKRITFIIVSRESLLLAIESEPLLSKLLPNIYYPKKMK